MSEEKKVRFDTETINNIRVKPVKLHCKEELPIFGGELFSCHVTPNVCIVSKKNSGKTCVIYKVIQTRADPENTSIIVFSSTVHKDPTHLAIKDLCKKKGIPYLGYDSIYSDTGENILDSLLQNFKEEAEKMEEKSDSDDSDSEDYDSDDMDDYEKKYRNYMENIQHKHNMFPLSGSSKLLQLGKELKRSDNGFSGSGKVYDPYLGHAIDNSVREEKGQKNKLLNIKNTKNENSITESRYSSPDYIIIFDDLSREDLKNPKIALLAKTNRHWKAMTIISTQSTRDIPPSVWKQTDCFLCFRSISQKDLDRIIVDCDICLSKESGILDSMYKDATREKYNFLYLDIRNSDFRKNFDKRYKIKLRDEDRDNL